MRSKHTGIRATVGSMAAWYPMAGCNLYNASKAAMRMLGLGLQSEIAGFGIKHCPIEPGSFRTELLKPEANMAKTGKESRMDDYAQLNATNDENVEKFNGGQLGDPVMGAEIIYEVLTKTGVAKGQQVPSFLPLGSDAVAEIAKSAQATSAQIKDWEIIAGLSDF